MVSEFYDGNGERYRRNSLLPIVFNVAKGYLYFKDSVGQVYLKCVKGQTVLFNIILIEICPSILERGVMYVTLTVQTLPLRDF